MSNGSVKRTADARHGTSKRRAEAGQIPFRDNKTVRQILDEINTLPIKTITTAYVIVAEDHTILCDASGGPFTVTLPDVEDAEGFTYNLKKIDSSANAVTIQPA